MFIPDLKILLADGDKTSRNDILSLFKMMGAKNLLTTDCGATALKAMRDEPIDLVILGTPLVVIDADHVVDWVRNSEEASSLSHLPIVSLVHDGEWPLLNRLVVAGANAALSRPTDAVRLTRAIAISSTPNQPWVSVPGYTGFDRRNVRREAKPAIASSANAWQPGSGNAAR
jgi:CheY-like chemotaxis protein